ncbi:MAG: hypothetical protein N4A70_05475 [Pelagimonas sp.]|jgi:hypothetical protein|nr:hypothetical protein [Pelagimonas sp.]
MTFDALIRAAVEENRQSFRNPSWSKPQKLAAHIALGALMVRLGRFDDYCKALELAGEGDDAMS